jgi:hypothetical protein
MNVVRAYYDKVWQQLGGDLAAALPQKEAA